jgi:pyruvate dehydrogenase E2 component (dihydrolipoamide acetyltransferase)
MDVQIPEISENVTSGTVVSLNVRIGDAVKIDEVLIELETDKAVVEIPSTVDGIVRELLVAEGDEIAVGAVIARIDTAADAAADAVAGAVAGAAAEAGAEAVAGAQASGVGETVAQPPAPPAAEAIQTPSPPQVVAPPVEPAAPATMVPPNKGSASAPASTAAAAPSVRRLARELGIDLGQVPASGPGGQVTATDVKAHARKEQPAVSTAAVAAQSQTAPGLPDFSLWGPVEIVPLAGIRKITAANMATAWQTIPHVTQFDEADVTDVEAFIRRQAGGVEKKGGKLTLTAVVVKIVAAALKQFPIFNASIDPAAETIVFKQYVHIGIATATDHGLLVPVVRDADRKSIAQIAVEIVELAGRARSRKIQPKEMAGATFTISNQGGIGGVAFTPIVNWPQAAILGISRTALRQRPVGDGTQLAARRVLPLSLSYDHRLIDGADAARFLGWVCQALVEPLNLILETP